MPEILRPNSAGTDDLTEIREEWSDAARKAAAAARGARKAGKSKGAQRIALKRAFLRAGGKVGKINMHKGDEWFHGGARTGRKGKVLHSYSWDEGKAEGENVLYKRAGKRGWKLYRNRSSSDSMEVPGRIGSRAMKRTLRRGLSYYNSSDN